MKKGNKRYRSNKAILDGITIGDIAEYLNRRPAEFMCTMYEYDIPVGGKRIKTISVSKDMKFYVYHIHKTDYGKLRFSVGIEAEKNSGNYCIVETEKNYEIGKGVAFGNDDCKFYLRFCLDNMTKDEIIEGIIRSSDIKVFVYLGTSSAGWRMLKRTENCEEIFVLESRIRERKCKLADIGKRLEELHREAENEKAELYKMEYRIAELRMTN